jgi:hypothetical protein
MKTSPYGLNSKTAKTSLRWLPLGTWISKFWVRGASSWLKRLRKPKFQLSCFLGRACRWSANFANGNGAWQTENFLLLKSCFLAIKSPKTLKLISKTCKFEYKFLIVNKQRMFMLNFSSLPATQTGLDKFGHFFKKISEFFRKTLERISKIPNLNIHLYLSFRNAWKCRISTHYMLPRPT